MEDYCAFSKNRRCINWIDYMITRQELEEANTLCHGNWIEIEEKNNYIKQLQELLEKYDIPYPKE